MKMNANELTTFVLVLLDKNDDKKGLSLKEESSYLFLHGTR